jgi:phosphoribosylglycinamide formyltransferase-1
VTIGVLVSGEGTNLQALVDAGLPVAAVASNVPGARALERAAAAGAATAVFSIEDYDDRAARDLAMADWLDAQGVALIVCAGYMQLLTPAFLDRFDAVINVHPSLLPAFPGLRPLEEALAAGIPVTGVTVHFVDDGIDTGPVILQERVPIEPGDTVETLHARLHEVEHRLLPEAARSYLAGELPSPRSA